MGLVMAGLILAASPARADRAEKHFPVQRQAQNHGAQFQRAHSGEGLGQK